MNISTSEVNTFKRCQRQWYYSYMDNLTSLGDNVHFWVGSAIHYALQKYYEENNKNWSTLIAAYKKYVKHNLVTANWFNEADNLAMSMLRAYWHYDLEQELYNVVSVEEKIVIPILNPWTQEQVSDATFTAIIDLVVRTTEGIVIVDHKTVSNIRSNEGLELDYQMTAYAYAYYRVYGEVPIAVMYNNILKNSHEGVTLLKDGKPSKNKTQRVSYETYLHYLQDNGIPVEEYEDILTYLKSKPVVVRQYASRTLQELKEFERILYLEHSDMQAKADFYKLYPNPSTWNCSGCMFLPLCKQHSKGEDGTFYLKNLYKQKESRIDYDSIE